MDTNWNETLNHFLTPKVETKNNENVTKEIINIDIDKLVSFRNNQPFSLYNELKQNEMIESIRKNGILVPIIVRKINDNQYEILAGHNRVECCRKLNLSTIPAQIVDCDDEMATLIMIDTNLCTRDEILPTQKGYAYKMKMNILKNSHNENQSTDESSQNEKLDKSKSLAQIYRYIRLTNLIKELQEKIDSKFLTVGTGVTLSYLTEEEQKEVNRFIDTEKCKINEEQAKRIRTSNVINYEAIYNIVKAEKQTAEKFTGKLEKHAFQMYKDKFSSNKEFTDLILKLLEQYYTSESE